MSNNPLQQYFRQPAIYIRLPSAGQFYPQNALEIPQNGELPVYPMTAIDEISYRTPDALFNGSAVINVIQSCIPGIKDAWSMPSMDVDTALIAIRVASYGHNMEIETECPECGEETPYAIDLRTILDKMRTPDYSRTIKYRDMEIFFKPMSYKNITDNNAAQFEEQKKLSLVPDSELPDAEKVKTLNAALKKITEITVKALSQNVAAVKTPTALVTEFEYIEEMLEHCDRALFTKIRDHIVKIKTDAEIQPLHLKCPKCSHEYSQNVTLDMTSFFGADS